MEKPSAPGPLLRALTKTRFHRVLEDVLGGRPKVIVALDAIRLEPLFENVATSAMASVEALGVEPVQTMHPAGEGLLGCLE
jgi:hypothetical protein